LALAEADKGVDEIAQELKTSDLDGDLIKMILMSEFLGSPISDKNFRLPQLTEKLIALKAQFASDEALKNRVSQTSRFLKFWKELTVDQVEGSSPQDVEMRDRLKSGLELMILQNYGAPENARVPRTEIEKMVSLIDQLEAKLKDVDYTALKISKAEVWSILLASAFAESNQKSAKPSEKPQEGVKEEPKKELTKEEAEAKAQAEAQKKAIEAFSPWIKSLEKANEDLKDFSGAEDISELLRATANIQKWIDDISEDEFTLSTLMGPEI
jgi:hypothetical protein